MSNTPIEQPPDAEEWVRRYKAAQSPEEQLAIREELVVARLRATAEREKADEALARLDRLLVLIKRLQGSP